MRRALMTNLAALMLIATLTGHVAARPLSEPRTVEAEYVTPAVGASPEEGTRVYYYDCLKGIGCAILKLGPKDRFASIEIADAAGRPVQGIVHTVPGFQEIGRFCGSTDEAWATGGARELVVHVVSGTCRDGSPSVATTGVVRATVSSRR